MVGVIENHIIGSYQTYLENLDHFAKTVFKSTLQFFRIVKSKKINIRAFTFIDIDQGNTRKIDSKAPPPLWSKRHKTRRPATSPPLLTARRATYILLLLPSCQFTRAPAVKLRLVIVFQYGCVITNMPSHFCVPGCSSNYDSKSHASTFQFPRDAGLKQKLVSIIRRANCLPSKHSVVCIKHFDERFIIQEDTFKRPDGSILSVKRDRLQLSNCAYSTISSKTFYSIYLKDFQLPEKNQEDRNRK